MKARENPFRVERLHRLQYLFPNGSLEDFLLKVEQASFRGAIVGPHGSGKTTLIEELMCEFQRSGTEFRHLRLRDDGRRANQQRVRDWLAAVPHSAVLILDSAGLLNWWAWRSVNQTSKKFAGLIVSTHRPGRLPTLIESSPTFGTFLQLVQNLDTGLELPHGDLLEIFTECQGNLRDCLRKLYDEYASGNLQETKRKEESDGSTEQC